MLKQWAAPPPRVEQPELLDLGEGTAQEVRENLRDMGRVNRWLGGHAALRRFLLPRLRRAARRGTPLRILDLASGAAYTSLMLAQWARRQGIALRIVALDASPRHLGVASERVRDYPEISLLSADARGLPFPPDSFDFVISAQFLHHLGPAELMMTVRALTTVCDGPVILHDLVRSRAAAFLFRHGAPLFFGNRLTRHDGLVSIAQAYTPREMREILSAAGVPRARIYRQRLSYRMTVVIDPDGQPLPRGLPS